MATFIWTGSRLLNPDNITNVEVKQPGKIPSFKTEYGHGDDYWGRVDFANETTVLDIERVGDTGEYAYPIRLSGEEARRFLVSLPWQHSGGADQLYAEDASVNDEARADLENLKREHAEAIARGERPDRSKEDLPF